MMLTNKQVDKMICIACSLPFGDHSRRELGRCLFRIQGTMVADSVANKEPKLDSDSVSKSDFGFDPKTE